MLFIPLLTIALSLLFFVHPAPPQAVSVSYGFTYTFCILTLLSPLLNMLPLRFSRSSFAFQIGLR